MLISPCSPARDRRLHDVVKSKGGFYSSQSEGFSTATEPLEHGRGTVKSSECEFMGRSFFRRVQMNLKR